MNNLPIELYSAAQVRELDRRAIEEQGLPGRTLMERAGQAAFAALRARWRDLNRIAVLCGSGNNGGDGYVVARLAHEAGIAVDLYHLGDPARMSEAAAAMRAALIEAGVEPQPFSGSLPSGAMLLVDGLLGIGFSGVLEEGWRAAVEALNSHPAPVLALDIPSGLEADTGRAELAVQAAMTVTFIGLKVGLFTGAGPAHAGEVVFADLQVPHSVHDGLEPVARRLDPTRLADRLGRRRRDAHKGDFGHVLVVGGDHGMAGAVRLAAEAAARCGAGLVSVATRAAHQAALLSGRPELMVHAVEEAEQLDPLLTRATVVVVGPGLGQGDWGRALFHRAIAAAPALVLDADALNLLATDSAVALPPATVLTPHPGEAARLLDNTQPLTDRLASARALAERYQGVVILKGAGSVIADPSGCSICSDGNPGMASGGMGDLLAGVVAALIGQGLAPGVAAQTGVCLHAVAGDRAAREGERGLLASDLLPHLRHLVNAL